MLCRFAHVQSVTFFAHAVVCTVILRRGRGSATFGPGRPRHTHATSVEGTVGTAGPGRPRHTRATSAEGAGGTAGPGRASSRRAEPQARGADGERAGGPDGTRNTSDAATTSVSEGGGRAWPPTTHPRHQCGGCRRAKVHSRVPEGGGRAWPGFEIDYSEPKARVWRSRGRAAALRHQDRFTRSRRHREPERPVATCDAATTSSI